MIFFQLQLKNLLWHALCNMYCKCYILAMPPSGGNRATKSAIQERNRLMNDMLDKRWKKNIRALPLVIFLLGAVLSGCSGGGNVREESASSLPSPQRSASKFIQIEEKSGTYVIRQGDEVEINVWGYPEFNTKAIIKEDGSMTMPLVGDVVAEGLTKDNLTDRIKTKLAEFIKGEIKLVVTVTSPTLKKITVLGAVNKQDNFPARQEMSLSEVLALAGGASTESDLHRVKITRGDRAIEESFTIDMAQFMDAGDMNQLPMVRPGDIVYVPKRENVVRDFSDFLRDAFFIFSFFRVAY
jgi:polysaccharide biosynthesis/export protein